jgi:hypothetical protein
MTVRVRDMDGKHRPSAAEKAATEAHVRELCERVGFPYERLYVPCPALSKHLTHSARPAHGRVPAQSLRA